MPRSNPTLKRDCAKARSPITLSVSNVTMPKPAHYLDLARRYREVDWVSEFQRLWAIFNHWLIAHISTVGTTLSIP